MRSLALLQTPHRLHGSGMLSVEIQRTSNVSKRIQLPYTRRISYYKSTMILDQILDHFLSKKSKEEEDNNRHYVYRQLNMNERKLEELQSTIHSLNSKLWSSSRFGLSAFDPARRRVHGQKSQLGLFQPSAMYHSSSMNEKGATIALTLAAVGLAAKAGQYTLQAFQELQKDTTMEETEKPTKAEDSRGETHADDTASGVGGEASTNRAEGEAKGSSDAGGTKKRENIFKTLFGLNVGSKFYEGGFEATMTRREAALILGVRESADAKRIKEAHRKILIQNHPDTGGSTYVASKINEAKELLMKGKHG